MADGRPANRDARPKPSERALEVGPGTGVYTLPVARAIEPEGRIDAFDVQQEMLDACGRATNGDGQAAA